MEFISLERVRIDGCCGVIITFNSDNPKYYIRRRGVIQIIALLDTPSMISQPKVVTPGRFISGLIELERRIAPSWLYKEEERQEVLKGVKIIVLQKMRRSDITDRILLERFDASLQIWYDWYLKSQKIPW